MTGGGGGIMTLGGVGEKAPSDDFAGGVWNCIGGDAFTGEVIPFTANGFGGDATFAFLIAVGPNTSVLTPIGSVLWEGMATTDGWLSSWWADAFPTDLGNDSKFHDGSWVDVCHGVI